LINDALTRMVQVYQQNQVQCGTVGCRLYFADNTIQHAGIVLFNNSANHLKISHRGFHSYYHFNADGVEKNIVGSTAAFLLVSRKLFEQIGGFNDSYQICFEDVELNLACLKYDKINYLANDAVCYHFESQTRDRKVSQTDYDNWRRFVTKLQPDIKLKLVGSQPGEIILGTGTI
jgi:GT2 family glycosyltransferase